MKLLGWPINDGKYYLVQAFSETPLIAFLHKHHNQAAGMRLRHMLSEDLVTSYHQGPPAGLVMSCLHTQPEVPGSVAPCYGRSLVHRRKPHEVPGSSVLHFGRSAGHMAAPRRKQRADQGSFDRPFGS